MTLAGRALAACLAAGFSDSGEAGTLLVAKLPVGWSPFRTKLTRDGRHALVVGYGADGVAYSPLDVR